MIKRRTAIFAPVAFALIQTLGVAAAQAADFSASAVPATAVESATPAAGVFAVVGGEVITQDQYRYYAGLQMRRKFFHGGVAPERIAEAHREAAQNLVDAVLLRQEAQRRGLLVDGQALAERLAAMAQANPSQAPPDVLKSAAEQDLLVDQLRAHVRQGVGRASAADVRNYFETHRDKFTVPERVRVAVILLKVPPYAPPQQWEQAQAKAAELWREIQGGVLFADVARRESQHESAANGGDLGLVHKGMLTQEVQEVVDRLQVGEVAQPAPILQGVVLVRLAERQPAAPLTFEQAQDRAQRLVDDENAERTWRELLAKLRDSTSVEIRG